MGLFSTIKREYDYVTGVLGTLRRIGSISPDDKLTVADLFEEKVDTYKANVAIRYEDKIFTYGELDERANQYAHWGVAQGLKAGDTVALFMDNRPDYVAIWLGLAKIGVTTALINYNLQGSGLAHCIKIAEPRAVIMGPDQIGLYRTATPDLPDDLAAWCIGGEGDGCQALAPILADMPDTRPAATLRETQRAGDLCLFIYTSGTTGLPKAARLTHARVIGMMRSFIVACNITERDRIYLTLPLYHATGGICGVGQAFLTGASLILRDKFSATHFWEDAVNYRATSFVYIGELCRYLVSAPPHPLEKAHAIRTGFGNGLRADVWQQFIDRFGIRDLVEFYGSTEGNVSFINVNKKIGAIGRLPPYMRNKLRHRIIRVDVETEQPIRDEEGFCMETEVDEVGEAIGEISDAPRQRFEGYKDPSQTEKKILRDVFKPGDMYFRTGDLMKRDEHHFIYFVDRMGDTYRWKAENVSTNEVAEALARFDAIELPNVYGVEIPGTEGRAGMAALILKPEREFDGKALAAHVDRELPYFARPVFIRVQKEAETTGTFKFRKVELVDQGIESSKIDDPLYVRLPDSDAFTPLTSDIEDKINKSEISF
ncbi:MAG: long-chain-acyl-CoA synthetase [Ponticaulis sp.]|nr:long-chain-acyl-CoA synthetase [Ponticaulis sp.]